MGLRTERPSRTAVLRGRRELRLGGAVGEGAGWVELEEVAEVLLDFGDGDFVDEVVGGCGGEVEVFEDAGAGVVKGEPLDCGGPGGRDDDHGETHGAGEVHGAGVEGEGDVGEAHDGGELEEAGLAGYAGGGKGEAGAEGFDGGRFRGGSGEDDLHVVVAMKGFGYGAETVFAPGLALGWAGLGDEDGDGLGLVDSLLAQEEMRCGDVVGRGEDLRFEERGVGVELFEERGAVAEGFEDAEVVGDLADAWIEA